jgi:hypothetical protein
MTFIVVTKNQGKHEATKTESDIEAFHSEGQSKTHLKQLTQ